LVLAVLVLPVRVKTEQTEVILFFQPLHRLAVVVDRVMYPHLAAQPLLAVAAEVVALKTV
jgi:hypothetical protein